MKWIVWFAALQSFSCLAMHKGLSIQELLQRGQEKLERKEFHNAKYFFHNARKKGYFDAHVYLMIAHKNLVLYHEEKSDPDSQTLADYHRKKMNVYYQLLMQDGDISTVQLIAQLDDTDAASIYYKWRLAQRLKMQKGDRNAFLKLGTYYMLIEQDYATAQKCFLNAVHLPIGAHNLSVLYEACARHDDAEEWRLEAKRLGYDPGNE